MLKRTVLLILAICLLGGVGGAASADDEAPDWLKQPAAASGDSTPPAAEPLYPEKGADTTPPKVAPLYPEKSAETTPPKAAPLYPEKSAEPAAPPAVAPLYPEKNAAAPAPRKEPSEAVRRQVAKLRNDPGFRDRLQKAVASESWTRFDSPLDFDVAAARLKDLAGSKVALEKAIAGDDWKKYFVSECYADMAQAFGKKNQDWTKGYLSSLESCNAAKSEWDRFNDESASLLNGMRALVAGTQRLEAIRGAYRRDLASIPTGTVVLGVHRWDLESSTVDVQTRMAAGAGAFLARSGNGDLLFSDPAFRGQKLQQDVFRSAVTGMVEEYEALPYTHQAEVTLYAVQKYRIYQAPLQKGKGGGVAAHVSSANLLPDVLYVQVKSVGGIPAQQQVEAALRQQAKRFKVPSEVPAAVMDHVEEALAEVQADNARWVQRLSEYGSRYAEEAEPVENEVASLRGRLGEEFAQLKSWIARVHPSYNLSVLENSVNRVLGVTTNGDAESCSRSIAQAEQKLKALSDDEFKQDWLQSQQRLQAKTDVRRMYFFTAESTFVKTGVRPQDAIPGLVERTLKRLRDNQDRLLAYDITVVEDGSLEKVTEAGYYAPGMVVGYYLPSPVFSISSEGGQTLNGLSVLLGLEVEFRRQSGETPQESVAAAPPMEERAPEPMAAPKPAAPKPVAPKPEPVALEKPAPQASAVQPGPEPETAEAGTAASQSEEGGAAAGGEDVPDFLRPAGQANSTTQPAPEPAAPPKAPKPAGVTIPDTAGGVTWFVAATNVKGTYDELAGSLPAGFAVASPDQVAAFYRFITTTAPAELKSQAAWVVGDDVEFWTDKYNSFPSGRRCIEPKTGAADWRTEDYEASLLGVKP